ncbi:Farnesyl diphosphate synthase [Anaerohalosphaera lusitana]|uniref:Farnesyl diphosphate synthase n=1 Tax=Anaerohalosphaera lusitana TaxID=1936003 RepID=A0A1U9NGE8_9BACT|nr:farnesyl diphosphate synthase [Anaerohalosphaera lusitana]AQT67009.1 Farnesyl diphosphate synthase [Anaerohalosphaera lusitana]
MSQEAADTGFSEELKRKAELANQVLNEVLASRTDIHPKLAEAMSYTLSAPGKRIRAAVIFWCSELIAGEVTDAAKIAAAAMETVHTYSLVHDDLPAMDDDDMRRGQPTCHRMYDEATAVLTGDALLTFAFDILANDVKNADISVKLIRTLAAAAGPAGMVGGQMQDLLSTSEKGDRETLEYIHLNKTAKMFGASAAMGAIAGGGTDEQVDSLYKYGLDIGLGFQVADDLLDISATSEELGKTAGKDQEQGKVTYPSLIGVERSRETAENLAADAIKRLENFGDRAQILRKLPRVLLDRTR